MHDLNLTLFYKTSFQIRALDGDGDALLGPCLQYQELDDEQMAC